MKHLIPVEGMEGYFRDSSSGAILNKNNLDFQSYVKKREKLSENRKIIDSLQNEVSSLKNDIVDIKSLLCDITSILKSDHK
jgi:hypothetical protein